MMFFKMVEEYATLIEEKLTQILWTIFQEEFIKQEVHRTNIISSMFKVTMEEIKKSQEHGWTMKEIKAMALFEKWHIFEKCQFGTQRRPENSIII